MSATDTVRAGLETGDPFILSFPDLTSLAAKPRVLKNRACHSHLSIRIPGFRMLTFY